ncbi:DNA cross-link repair 1A protein isoform X1 [Hippocampus zosterae]|uniref:DNA cross-link repair 1A protein isoform X1 n=1 Tax=Hippocampus zosterae TaxID=109293 RepID=UPI00223DB74E|nr:DNA cross-link repair 1A protein isoform X1 [Hippocampus zosterae]
MSQKTGSESDIWEYKPLAKKKKRRESSCTRRNAARRRCTTELKSWNTRDSPTTPRDVAANGNNGQCDANSSSLAKEAKEAYCPICQMPFCILLVQSQRWHVAECLDEARDTCKECPDGLLCSSSIPNHYKKFKHTQLANARANGQALPNHSESRECRSPSRSASGDHMEAPPSPPPSQATNGTPSLPLRSPGPDDMKKKGWSSGGRSSVTPSQGNRTETPAEEQASQDGEDRISYSPLSELPADKDAVHEDASEDEDSMVLFSEDEPLPDVRDRPEDTGRVSPIAGGSLGSPQKMVLEQLRESLRGLPFGASRSSTVPRRKGPSGAGRGSGLKQTDIGVFFGLKALRAEERAETSGSAAGGASSGRNRMRNAAADVDRGGDDGGHGGDVVEAATRRTKGRSRDHHADAQPRRCPFYKKIPGTTFAIDAFRYGAIEGITAYFLTHFHSDHYGGLTSKSTFPIYCNKITGNLVKSKLKVAEQHVHILPMNTRVSVEGAQVTLLDANQYVNVVSRLLLRASAICHLRMHSNLERESIQLSGSGHVAVLPARRPDRPPHGRLPSRSLHGGLPGAAGLQGAHALPGHHVLRPGVHVPPAAGSHQLCRQHQLRVGDAAPPHPGGVRILLCGEGEGLPGRGGGSGLQSVPLPGQVQHHVLSGVGAHQAPLDHRLDGGAGPRASHDATQRQKAAGAPGEVLRPVRSSGGLQAHRLDLQPADGIAGRHSTRRQRQRLNLWDSVQRAQQLCGAEAFCPMAAPAPDRPHGEQWQLGRQKGHGEAL